MYSESFLCFISLDLYSDLMAREKFGPHLGSIVNGEHLDDIYNQRGAEYSCSWKKILLYRGVITVGCAILFISSHRFPPGTLGSRHLGILWTKSTCLIGQLKWDPPCSHFVGFRDVVRW